MDKKIRNERNNSESGKLQNIMATTAIVTEDLGASRNNIEICIGVRGYEENWV